MPILSRCVLALTLSAFCLLAWRPASAQGSPPPEPALTVAQYCARAQRLLDFGRPLLAKSQLEKARALEPGAREVLLGFLRLYTRGIDVSLNAVDGKPWAEALAKGFADDYDACVEVGYWMYLVSVTAEPPTPEHAKAAIERLEAEMPIFLDLGDYILDPKGDLPKSAQGRPNLSLAYLARAARQSPGAEEVAFLAAQELMLRGLTFEGYATVDPVFSPFAQSAQQLYVRAEKLFRRAVRSNARQVEARISLVKVLARMKRYVDAVKESIAALQVSPNNLGIVELLLNIATEAGDMGLLIENLETRHRILDDSDTALDLSVAKRIGEKLLGFQRWREYRTVAALRGPARVDAADLLLKAEPRLVEVHVLAAEGLMDVAARAATPEDAAKAYQGALKALGLAGELKGKLADISRIAGICHWRLGQFAEAAAQFDETAKLDATDTAARDYAEGARDIATGQCKPEDFLELLDIRVASDIREKQSRLAALVKKAPKYAQAWLLMGKVCELQGANIAALEAFEKALENRADSGDALWGAGTNAMTSGDFDKALRSFEKLGALRPDTPIVKYWSGFCRYVIDGGEKAKKAADWWFQSRQPALLDSERQRRLEQALRDDPGCFEALRDLGKLISSRGGDMDRATELLREAVKRARDDEGKSEARHGLGEVAFRLRKFPEAADHFEAAYVLSRGEGHDLMLAALARHSGGEEAAASVNMRKLATDLPSSSLIRPSLENLVQLRLKPAADAGHKRVSPGYAPGDKASFDFRLKIRSDGGGSTNQTLEVAYTVNIEVAATPEHGGLWKLNLTFADAPPGPVYGALNDLKLSMDVSPWFGLTRDVLPGGNELADVVNPAVQALSEAFCAGLGDAKVTPPYVWRNERTQGPPHFGKESIEASAITELFGDTIRAVRRAAGGRRLGLDPSVTDSSRWLEAVVEFAGARASLRRVSIVIEKQELTQKKDDVVSTFFEVTLDAR